MSFTKCPGCGNLLEKKHVETYISLFNDQEYKLYYCPNCDLQWWEPLKIIPEFYEMEGDEGYELFHMGLREEIGENHKMFFKYIPLKSGRLLDVGCGDGVFLKEAQKAGFEVWGIDFDSKSIKVCQEKWGLKNTFVMSPQEFADFCQKEGLKFDVITFFEVLEHQDKPVEFLEAIKSMLKPGGYIAGSVPNRESLMMKINRIVCPQIDFPPHHFLRFSKKALNNFFTDKSLNDILIKPTPVKIAEFISLLQVLITGIHINKILKKKIVTHELVGEGTIIYKELSLWRKAIFRGIKSLRFLFFLIPALALKTISEGPHLYFQCRK